MHLPFTKLERKVDTFLTEVYKNMLSKYGVKGRPSKHLKIVLFPKYVKKQYYISTCICDDLYIIQQFKSLQYRKYFTNYEINAYYIIMYNILNHDFVKMFQIKVEFLF